MQNLDLFPDSSSAGSLTHRPSIQSMVLRMQEWNAQPNSPVRAIRLQPARAGQFADYPEAVRPELRAMLERRGVRMLYSHQAEAFQAIQAGRHTVIVTPTASGKTLCYNLPVLNRLLAEPQGRAFYLFPTKALAEDQLHELKSAIDGMGSRLGVFTYDGDTPQDARKAIRERASVALTNPDMLHSGILPHHTKWAKFFENLQYFIIDEMHYYRGVYGSHLANIIRRLKRICAFYGSRPQFILCSATIANPKDLAESLLEEEVEVVSGNGAPGGEKYFVFYNPPVVNKQLGIRRSYLHESKRMAVEMIDRGQQTLVFANNRLATEILITYLKDACEKGLAPPGTIRGYRGGYLPRERREIERKLREGEIRGVVATNALELGIDIGSLDAVVMAGYPGTVAATWQRAGRAGRRQNASMAVLVASSNPVDQYIIEHPDYFFGKSPEHAFLNANNLEILLNHLKCAAFELPVQNGEKFGPHETEPLCRFLGELGLVHPSAGAWHWTSDTYPADAISLRAVTSDNFVVIDTTSEPKVIAEVSFPAALVELHEKAIYLHEARQYQVEKFDYEQRKAYVRQVQCDYFTDAIDYTQVKELDRFEAAPQAGALAAHGEVRVNRQVVGFKKVKFYTLENVGAGHLSMPEQEMHTTSFWLHFPAPFLAALGNLTPAQILNGLAGLGRALRAMASLLLMCDPRDLGAALTEDIAEGVKSFEPNLYLYDTYPGGIGQSQPLFELRHKLLVAAEQMLGSCPCEAGCPSCVGPAGESGEGAKAAARLILAALLTAEAPAAVAQGA